MVLHNLKENQQEIWPGCKLPIWSGIGARLSLIWAIPWISANSVSFGAGELIPNDALQQWHSSQEGLIMTSRLETFAFLHFSCSPARTLRGEILFRFQLENITNYLHFFIKVNTWNIPDVYFVPNYRGFYCNSGAVGLTKSLDSKGESSFYPLEESHILLTE